MDAVRAIFLCVAANSDDAWMSDEGGGSREEHTIKVVACGTRPAINQS